MKTSYYSSRKMNASHFPVRISAFNARFFKTAGCAPALYPAVPLLKQLKANEITMARYEKEYLKRLDATGVDAIRSQLDGIQKMSGGREPVLLCFCGPSDRCHRRMFAEWWEKKTGEKILEM